MNDASPLSAATLLQWHIDVGADEAVGDAPTNRTATPPPVAAPVVPLIAESTAAAPIPPAEATALAAGAATVEDLQSVVESFSLSGSQLWRPGAVRVFAQGAPDAPVMLVGDAATAEDARAGHPFAGEAGVLLDKMLAAIGLARDAGVYLTLLVNAHAPNAAPSAADTAAGLAFAERHIALLKPKILVCVGGVAAKALLRSAQSITRLRGQWIDYEGQLPAPIPAMALFHPAYLIGSPAQKRPAWEDLQMLKGRLSVT